MLIGREVYLTMRSLIVTHNIGHSVLEGFENKFAPVVLEDRAQIGLGVVVYAGCRVGAEAIVASNSYVTGDIAAGSFAIGVPAKVTGSSSHKPSRTRQAEIARRIVSDLQELLALRGHDVTPVEGGFAVNGVQVVFQPSSDDLCLGTGGRAHARAPRRRPTCWRRRPRSPRAPSPRVDGRRRARLGARALPQTGYPFRARTLALQGRLDLDE